MSTHETINNNTFYIALTYVSITGSVLNLTLTEPSGPTTTPATVPLAIGQYTVATFATLLQIALNAHSPNTLTYTVTPLALTFGSTQLPGISPDTYGSSYKITNATSQVFTLV